jgi:cytochrome c-type biogenesis protein CcmH/NrfG
MNHRRRITCCTAALCFVALGLCACGNSSSTSAPVAGNQNTASTNRTTASQITTQSPRTPSSANSQGTAAPPAAVGGEPVDTSKYDAEIKRLEQQSKKNPPGRTTQMALARAYADRGDALTGVRQYRAALGDYRRALRLDPNNEQARQMSTTIIGILQSMGRDVPPEGQEPPPLPLKQ